MSRSRMFGDDEPATPSPRTTIVGGQPAQAPGALPPVPTGLQRLLRLASVDEPFRRELLARRGDLAAAAEVALTPSEVAILHAIPAAQLEAMITSLPPPAADRRSFLRQTAATAVMLLGGAALSSCRQDMRAAGGAAPDVPERATHRLQAPGGAAPDYPPLGPPLPPDGGPPRPPRPGRNETSGLGGLRAPHPPPRPDKTPVTDGIRPDVPKK